MGANFFYVRARVPKNWRKCPIEDLYEKVDYKNLILYLQDSCGDDNFDEEIMNLYLEEDDTGEDENIVAERFEKMASDRRAYYEKKYAQTRLKEALESLYGRDYAEEECTDYNELITGGMSWGDSPTESYDAICLIAEANLVPAVIHIDRGLTDAEFEQVVANVKAEKQKWDSDPKSVAEVLKSNPLSVPCGFAMPTLCVFNFPSTQDATSIATLKYKDREFDVIVDELDGNFEIRVWDSEWDVGPVAKCGWNGDPQEE